MPAIPEEVAEAITGKPTPEEPSSRKCNLFCKGISPRQIALPASFATFLVELKELFRMSLFHGADCNTTPKVQCTNYEIKRLCVHLLSHNVSTKGPRALIPSPFNSEHSGLLETIVFALSFSLQFFIFFAVLNP